MPARFREGSGSTTATAINRALRHTAESSRSHTMFGGPAMQLFGMAHCIVGLTNTGA